jgi:hypothetical protein
MSSTTKCKCITKQNKQCTRNAAKDGYCTQHLKMQEKYDYTVDEVKVPEIDSYISTKEKKVSDYDFKFKELKENVVSNKLVRDAFPLAVLSLVLQFVGNISGINRATTKIIYDTNYILLTTWFNRINIYTKVSNIPKNQIPLVLHIYQNRIQDRPDVRLIRCLGFGFKNENDYKLSFSKGKKKIYINNFILKNFDKYIFYSKRYTIDEEEIKSSNMEHLFDVAKSEIDLTEDFKIVKKGDLIYFNDIDLFTIFNGVDIQKFDNQEINDYSIVNYFEFSFSMDEIEEIEEHAVWLRTTDKKLISTRLSFNSNVYQYTTSDDYKIISSNNNYQSIYEKHKSVKLSYGDSIFVGMESNIIQNILKDNVLVLFDYNFN